jgi:hypothetical protein
VFPEWIPQEERKLVLLSEMPGYKGATVNQASWQRAYQVPKAVGRPMHGPIEDRISGAETCFMLKKQCYAMAIFGK